MVDVHEILVDDVLYLDPGDLAPVDGIFIDGHDLKCDESSATGESDALKKTGGDQAMRALELRQTKSELDPSIISGQGSRGYGHVCCDFGRREQLFRQDHDVGSH
jgi:P-type Ca2+ transporter type 2C